MKKTLIISALLAALLLIVGVGSVAAQAEEPGSGTVRGPLHDYIVTAFADNLNLNVEDVNAALESGQTLHDLAIAEGITVEDLPALMQQVFSVALDEAVADGVITQERADRMLQRMQSRGAEGFGTGRGDRMGAGGRGSRMGGSGDHSGSGMRPGGFGGDCLQQTNP